MIGIMIMFNVMTDCDDITRTMMRRKQWVGLRVQACRCRRWGRQSARTSWLIMFHQCDDDGDDDDSDDDDDDDDDDDVNKWSDCPVEWVQGQRGSWAVMEDSQGRTLAQWAVCTWQWAVQCWEDGTMYNEQAEMMRPVAQCKRFSNHKHCASYHIIELQ